MAEDLVARAHWGDLTGQNWAGLVRLSFEVDASPTPAAIKESDSDNAAPGRRFVPLTGRNIKGRDEQEKDAQQFVESHGGRRSPPLLSSPRVGGGRPRTRTRGREGSRG
ncbi:hypothetical protein [Kitasatospora sp. NPDC093102]|uniref:hypothetical protein n=1 Tax=Kitasatospora sp. NPDC093102 TaxID=3155069 RepID=UPI0034215E9C